MSAILPGMTPRQLKRYRTRIERMSRDRFARLLRISDVTLLQYEEGMRPIPERIGQVLAALPAPTPCHTLGSKPRFMKELALLKAGIRGSWRGPSPNSWALRL